MLRFVVEEGFTHRAAKWREQISALPPSTREAWGIYKMQLGVGSIRSMEKGDGDKQMFNKHHSAQRTSGFFMGCTSREGQQVQRGAAWHVLRLTFLAFWPQKVTAHEHVPSWSVGSSYQSQQALAWTGNIWLQLSEKTTWANTLLFRLHDAWRTCKFLQNQSKPTV